MPRKKPDPYSKKAKEKDRILVITVDRDDDIGHKTALNGPLVGRESLLKAAMELGLSDPGDSDTNALFQAVRVYDGIRKKYKSEVAALTGNRSVGLPSDKEISEQLEKVLSKFKADFAILVTDGSEDEHVLPIIQSRLPILSVDRVVVKQAQQLESGYYKLKDFIEETMENPKYSRLIFGIPAIAILIYSVFGMDGWRVILAVLGIYLFIKGFRLDHYVVAGFEELSTSFTRRRFAFFSYIVSIMVAILATVRGYDAAVSWFHIGLFETASAFVASSIFYYYLSGAISWVGKSITTDDRSGKSIVSVTIFGFAIALVIYNAAQLIIKPDLSLFNFIFSIVFGFALIFAAILLEWKR
jgi:putative membrane protein